MSLRFFVQICITGRDELLEDIQNALPLMAKQLHLDTLHLDLPSQERQTVQVHAFIPGGTSVTLSRDVVILCRTRNVHESAAQKLKRTFADLSTLPFHVTAVHPAMGWIEPVMTPLTHYMVVVFDPPESAFKSYLEFGCRPSYKLEQFSAIDLLIKSHSCNSSDSSGYVDTKATGAPATSTLGLFMHSPVEKW